MQTIVMFSEQRWGALSQRAEQFVFHLARQHRVVVVEEPVAWEGEVSHVEPTRAWPNVTVVVPRLSTRPTGPERRDPLACAALIRGWLAASGVHDFLAWFSSPSQAGVIDALSPAFTIHDCADDRAHLLAADPGGTTQATQFLPTHADLVIANGPGLCAALRRHHPNVICIPDGVDADCFSPFHAARLPGHVAFAANLHRDIGYPRLGFHGSIDDRLDVDLIGALSDANPNWHVVLSGPVAPTAASRLPRRRNLHVLEALPRRLLPHLIAQWDVCILPYATNDATRALNPSQALESLAYGRAVVSTPLADVQALYGDAVRIASTPASFIEACRACAFAGSADEPRRRQAAAEVVARSTWRAAMDVLDEALESLRKTWQPAADGAPHGQGSIFAL